jgi:hypothetical protein
VDELTSTLVGMRDERADTASKAHVAATYPTPSPRRPHLKSGNANRTSCSADIAADSSCRNREAGEEGQEEGGGYSMDIMRTLNKGLALPPPTPPFGEP